MEENLTNNPQIVISKTPLLRTFAVTFNILSRIAVLILCLVGAGIVVLSLFGSDIGNLFDKNANLISVGLLGTLGILVYVIIFFVAFLVIAFAISYITLNKNYTRLAKAYKGQPSYLFALNRKCTGAIVCECISLVLAICVFAVFGIVIGFVNLVMVVLLIPAVLQVIAFVLAIVERIKGKKEYKNLTDEEKAEADEKSKVLVEKSKKLIRQKRVGKLY